MKNTIKKILLGVFVCAIIAVNIGIVYELYSDSAGFSNMKFYSEAFANANVNADANMATGTGKPFTNSTNSPGSDLPIIQH